MVRSFRRLMLVLAGSTRSDLRRQVEFLRAENQILRSRLTERIRTTAAERARLIRLGRPLGAAIKELISIVSPATFIRWVNHPEGRAKHERPPGRPRSSDRLRDLILRMAKETDWGSHRIRGELDKLGFNVSRNTVARILREAGVPSAPERSQGTWDEFLRAQAKTLWACDFVTARIVTRHGFAQAFFIVFMHIQTRRVVASEVTITPSAMWAAGQLDAFVQTAQRGAARPEILIHDRDSKFGKEFGHALKELGISPLPLPIRSPNLNAHVERFIGTLRRECLDRFVVVGRRHLEYLVREYLDYYNRQRPHTALDSRAPAGPEPPQPVPKERIRAASSRSAVACEQRLGGAIRHYYRRAA